MRHRQPAWRIFIGLADRPRPEDLAQAPPGVAVVPVESLNLPELEGIARRHNVVELCTALKAFYFERLFAALHNAHVRSRERRSLWRTLARGARQSIPEPVKRLLRG